MIEVFEGRLGGGKTYTAVWRIAKHLSGGGTVVTNIRIKTEGLREYVGFTYGVEYEADQLWLLPNQKIGEFHRHVPYGSLRGSGENLRVLVVVDEAHLYFNARDWNQTSRELLAFLTQSDKVSVDVIFISQSALNIDKQFGRLVQYIWRFRDLEKWKIPGLGVAYPFSQILVIQYDYDGKTMLERRFVRKDTLVFSCYETAALLTEFPDSAGKATARTLKKVEKKGNRMLKYIIPCGLLAVVLCVYYLTKSFQSTAAPPVAKEVREVSRPMPLAGRRGVEEEAKALFDLYEENFRGWTEADKTLITESGWYQLNEMSGRGLVTAVSPRRAKILGADGRTVWVVANRSKRNISEDKTIKTVEEGVK